MILSALLGEIQSLSLGVLRGENQGVFLGAPRACFRIPCRDARPRPLLALYPVG